MNSKTVQKPPPSTHHPPPPIHQPPYKSFGNLANGPQSSLDPFGLVQSRFREASVSIVRFGAAFKARNGQQRQVVESRLEWAATVELKQLFMLFPVFFQFKGARSWISESVEHEELKANQVHKVNIEATDLNGKWWSDRNGLSSWCYVDIWKCQDLFWKNDMIYICSCFSCLNILHGVWWFLKVWFRRKKLL